MAYLYESLASPFSDIRLAILQPGRTNDTIRISFCIQSLEDASLNFQALSYVWGSEDNASYASVGTEALDDGAIPMTRNLDVALRHLRHEHKERTIWIDALCIDQNNLQERSEQVALMGKIYGLASRVVVWLGPEADRSDMAFNVLRILAHHVEIDWINSTFQPSSVSDNPDWADLAVPLPFKARELDDVYALFGRPYFERTWTRQEIALGGKNSVVQSGQQQIPWKDFKVALGCVWRKNHHPEASDPNRRVLSGMHAANAYDLCDFSERKCDFTEVRMSLRTTQCKDPRDRLYAVLSLLGERDKRLKILPDYSRKVEDVYTEVALRVLVDDHRLCLLQTCELSSRVLQIPSWVPDWSSRLKFKSYPRTKWSACCWISADVTNHGGGAIGAKGVSAAQIEKVIEVNLDEYEWYYDEVLAVLREIGAWVKAADNIDQPSTHCIEKICRALIGDQFSECFDPPRRDRPEFKVCAKFLGKIWSTTTSWLDLVESREITFHARLYLDYCHLGLVGRCFFHGSGGCIGLAPIGARKGDLISILLGCTFPVVLRSFAKSETPSAWQVVGVCYAHGLMKGEAIYGERLPKHYRPVSQTERYNDLVDGYDYALYDPTRHIFKTDPAQVLGEAGIEVDSYIREPHSLNVSSASLRAASVPLHEFVLV